jgi:hypothetical protein
MIGLRLHSAGAWFKLAPRLMPLIDYIMLVITICLEILLTIVLWRRRAYRGFPFFFVYAFYSFTTSTIKLAVIANYNMYFWVYWCSDVGFVALDLLVLHEVFRNVFLLFYEDDWWFVFIFPVASMLIFVLAAWVWVAHPPMQAGAMIRLIFSAEMAVNIIQSLLFGLFMLLIAHSRLHWRSYPFGIVGGFALYSLGAWATYWVRSDFGTKVNFFLVRAVPSSYILALIFWLLTFARPSEEDEEPKWRLSITPDEALQRLEEYTRFVDWYRNRKKRKRKT